MEFCLAVGPGIRYTQSYRNIISVMKAGTFVMTTLLLLGLAAGGTYLVKPEVYEGILPDSMIGKKAPKKAKKKGKKKGKKKAQAEALAEAPVAEKAEAEEAPAVVSAAEEDFDEPAGSADARGIYHARHLHDKAME